VWNMDIVFDRNFQNLPESGAWKVWNMDIFSFTFLKILSKKCEIWTFFSITFLKAISKKMWNMDFFYHFFEILPKSRAWKKCEIYTIFSSTFFENSLSLESKKCEIWTFCFNLTKSGTWKCEIWTFFSFTFLKALSKKVWNMDFFITFLKFSLSLEPEKSVKYGRFSRPLFLKIL